MEPLCEARTVHEDREHGVKRQWVRCIRNEGHKGMHLGAARTQEENIEKVMWT